MAETKLTGLLRHGDPRLEAYKVRAWAWLRIVRADMLAGRVPNEEPYRMSLQSIARLTPPIKPASFLAFDLHGDDGDAA